MTTATATTAADGAAAIVIPSIDGGGPIDARLRAMVEELKYLPPMRWDVHPLNAQGKEEGVALRIDGPEWDDWDNTGTFPPGKYRRKLWVTSPHKLLGGVDFIVAKRVSLEAPETPATGPAPEIVAKFTELLQSIGSRLDRLESGGGGGGRGVDPLLQLMLTQQADTNKILLQALLTQKGGGGGGASVDSILGAVTKVHEFAEKIHDRDAGGGGGGEESVASIVKALAPHLGPVLADMLKSKRPAPSPESPHGGNRPPDQVRPGSVREIPPARLESPGGVAVGDVPDGGEPVVSPLAGVLTPDELAEIDIFADQVAACAATPRPSARLMAVGLLDLMGDMAEDVALQTPPGHLATLLIGHAPKLEAHRAFVESIEAEYREMAAGDDDADTGPDAGEGDDAGEAEGEAE